MHIVTLNCFDPIKIAKSGQAFRYTIIDDSHVELVAKGKYLQIAMLGDNRFAFSCSQDEFEAIWYEYFNLDYDYSSLTNLIDKEDEYLKNAESFGRGIRILRQDIWEMIISYIISQRKSIPAITTSVNRLSELRGQLIGLPELDAPFVSPAIEKYHAFPTYQELADITMEELASIGAGYRAEYIKSAIDDFNSGKLSVGMLSTKNDTELYEILMNMRGVGTKVANCVMLFAFHRTASFPIDVWIQRILDKYYGGQFNKNPYGDTAGIMQQFMFYYERCEKTHI